MSKAKLINSPRRDRNRKEASKMDSLVFVTVLQSK